MAKIHIINRNKAWKKLKGYLKFGLIAATVYGTVWTGSRAINQYKLTSNMQHFSRLVRLGEYDQALEGFDKLVNKGFLISSVIESKRENLRKEIKIRKKEKIERALHINDYTNALQSFSSFVNEDSFTEDELKGLEARIKNIHPDNLIELADNTEDPALKMNLYSAAKRELDDLGETRVELKDKLIGAYLKELEGVIETREVAQVSGRMNSLVSYIGSENVNIKDSEKLSFVDSYEKFLVGTLLKEKGDLIGVSNQLDGFNSLASALGIKDVDVKMKNWSTQVVKYASEKIEGGINFVELDYTILDLTAKICRSYNPEGLEKVVGLYLNAYDRVVKDATGDVVVGVGVDLSVGRKFLDNGLIYSEDLAEDKQNEMKVGVAERYIQIAEQLDLNEGYLLFQTARGLYNDGGVSGDDARIVELDERVQNKLK